MSQATLSANDQRIDYIEFIVPDVAVARTFYSAVFGWAFEDWGPGYASFNDGRLTGGFSGGGAPTSEGNFGGGPLVILYARDLEATEARVTANGGTIVKPTFSFPGGRRFHFQDPSGHVLAVWSEAAPG